MIGLLTVFTLKDSEMEHLQVTAGSSFMDKRESFNRELQHSQLVLGNQMRGRSILEMTDI